MSIVQFNSLIAEKMKNLEYQFVFLMVTEHNLIGWKKNYIYLFIFIY